MYKKLPLLQRIYLTIRAWFGSADLTTVLKEQELEEVRRRVVKRDATVADVSIPALKAGFHQRARAVAQHAAALKPILAEVRGSGAGVYLREMLKRLDPDLHRTIEASCLVPENLLLNASTTPSAARSVVLDHLHQSLEVSRRAIETSLGPVWNSLEAIAALAAVDFGGLIPESTAPDIRTPLRIVRKQLTELACVIEFCLRTRNPGAIRFAAEISRAGGGSRAASAEALWTALDALTVAANLADLVRLAADEPRLTLVQIAPKTEWWASFCLSWEETIEVGPAILRRRTLVLDDILSTAFGIEEPNPAWIPPSLYQRTAGALRRLFGCRRFRDARTLTGALAREQNLMPSSERASALEAQVELDQAFTRLEELLGSGEGRGRIGDEIRRLNHSDGEPAVTGMQKVNVYAKYRLDLRIVIDHSTEVLGSISHLFERNRKLVRQAVKARAVRVDLESDDLPPLEILTLIIDGYRKVVIGLRSLLAVENELIGGAGGAIGSGGGSAGALAATSVGDEGDVGVDEAVDVSPETELRPEASSPPEAGSIPEAADLSDGASPSGAARLRDAATPPEETGSLEEIPLLEEEGEEVEDVEEVEEVEELAELLPEDGEEDAGGDG